MVEKKNNILSIVCTILFLLCVPSRIIATNIYCVPQEPQLPYPGMLSNHPLYVVKKIRDKILKQFINKPEKILEYYLYESNKQFSEMLMQIQKKNDGYVINAGLQSGNYLTLFVSSYHRIALLDPSIQNKLTCDFYNTVEFQIKKYDEIIISVDDVEKKKQLIQIVDQIKQNKEGFDNLLTTMNAKRIIYE